MNKVIGDTDFDTEVLESTLPVMVEFYASWCGHCKNMEDIVDIVGQRFNGELKTIKIDVDNAPDTAFRYNVESVPTFVMFENGEPVNKIVGEISEGELEKQVKELIK